MRLVLSLMVTTLVLLTAQQAFSQSGTTYERGNYSKIEPDKHTVTGLGNASKQSVVMVLDTNVTLDEDETWTSDDIKLQSLLYGYPTKANLIVDLVSGSFSVVMRENYGTTPSDTVHLQNAQDPDSGQVIIPTTSPWSAAGVWRWPSDFAGGSSFYYVITAESDGTVIRNVGTQLMP